MTINGNCHVIVGFFEIANTSRNAIALQENNVLMKHMLDVYVLAYVKDERNNLSTMTFILPWLCLIWSFGIMDAFSKDLLGPCNVQVLSICHK
jgi:hypothetical protein